jgi:hypothetical protein
MFLPKALLARCRVWSLPAVRSKSFHGPTLISSPGLASVYAIAALAVSAGMMPERVRLAKLRFSLAEMENAVTIFPQAAHVNKIIGDRIVLDTFPNQP